MSPSEGPPFRVLLVEDAFDHALLVKAFLGSLEEFDVVHTQDGDAAVGLLESEEWALVVTDLNLPGMDGFEVIRAARRLRPSTPVLATTGYTGSAYQEQAFRAGATELLTKPLDREEFVARVRDLVGFREKVVREPREVALAVGGRPGDVEMGCGGTLARAAAAGVDVVIVPLCCDDDIVDEQLAGARSAAEILGARAVIEPAAMQHTSARAAHLDRLVDELRPAVVYLPAMDESHPDRLEAFRVGRASTALAPRILGYQTATTGFAFHPSHRVDIAGQMMTKMESLAAYQEAGAGRPDLAPRLAQAYARYWGRLERFGEVEPFEIIREGS